MLKQSIKSFTMNWGEYVGLPCTLPASMYSVLFEHNIIDDPFCRLNEKKYTDYSNKPVDFFAEFEAEERALRMKHVLLRMSRLDTVCNIYLNGKLLDSVDNMHRTYLFDVKELLVKGTNQLHIAILPPHGGNMHRSEIPISCEDSCRSDASDIRKALFMSGCDFAPKLPDMGIYGEVELLSFDKKIIDNIVVKQIHTENAVSLELTLETLGEDDMSRAVATLVSPAGNVYYGGFSGNKSQITVKNPDLWWPNGLGAPNLYKLSVNLYSESEIEDSKEMRIGLRTLTVSSDKEETGEPLELSVNSVKFFSMGASYVPEDSLIARITPERTRRLLKDCRNANFNTIHVCGTGYYPQDWFYDICDEYGIIVWQDFMSCCDAPVTDKLREEYTAEFCDNFRRIAHHACLGIVCGNKGIERISGCNVNDCDCESLNEHYRALYEELLPPLAEKYIPDVYYWYTLHSSDRSFDGSGSMNCGSSGLLDSCVGGVRFEYCPKQLPRFCAEYGSESLPSIKTVKSYAEGDDLNIFSPVMELHQKNPGASQMLTCHAGSRYRYPNGLDELIYTTQIMQMDTNRCLVEHIRANRGVCKGFLYSQINDCWPAISRSSIDYFGRWKASHYGAKKMYAPVLITALNEGTRVKFVLCNERMSSFDGGFTYAIMDNENRAIFKDAFPISADSMSTRVIHNCDFGDIVCSHENEYYLVYSVSGGGFSSKGTLLFTNPKAFEFKKPTFISSVTGSGKYYVLTIQSDVYAKSVEVDFESSDAVFEDNYFDITEHTPIRISLTTREVTNADALYAELRLRSVYDIGR